MPIEVAKGSINGVNRIFEVSADYRPGSTQSWVNGLTPKRSDDDGWEELGGKKIQLKEAPQQGDVVQVFFIPL